MKTYKALEALKKRREKRKENIGTYRALEILKIKRWKEKKGCTCNTIVKCKNCQTKKKKL